MLYKNIDFFFGENVFFLIYKRLIRFFTHKGYVHDCGLCYITVNKTDVGSVPTSPKFNFLFPRPGKKENAALSSATQQTKAWK